MGRVAAMIDTLCIQQRGHRVHLTSQIRPPPPLHNLSLNTPRLNDHLIARLLRPFSVRPNVKKSLGRESALITVKFLQPQAKKKPRRAVNVWERVPRGPSVGDITAVLELGTQIKYLAAWVDCDFWMVVS